MVKYKALPAGALTRPMLLYRRGGELAGAVVGTMTDEDGVMLSVTEESVGVTFRVKLGEKVPKMEEKTRDLEKLVCVD